MTSLPAARERARPMSPEDRRAALVRDVVPLLREHGPDVSTRQIADACGVAEGTLFRAFGDKDALISAAIDAFFDPQPLRDALAAIDRTLPPEAKVRLVLDLLRERFAGVSSFAFAMRLRGGPPPGARPRELDWIEVVQAVFEPDRHDLAVPPETVAAYLRLTALATSVPHFNTVRPFDGDELAGLVLHGVLAPAPTDTPASMDREA